MSIRILALDTTTEACSVAVGERGVLGGRWERLPRGHSARLLPMVDEVLDEAGWTRSQVDVIAFCRGPGSFTGVRISAGAAQGLAMGLDRPVVPVSTLRAIAQGVMATRGDVRRVAAAIDARMGEVYYGPFVRGAAGLAEASAPERVCAPEAVSLAPASDDWFGAGTGFGARESRLAERLAGDLAGVDPERLPDAADLVPIARAEAAAGRLLPPEAATPVYLRNRVAERPRKAPDA